MYCMRALLLEKFPCPSTCPTLQRWMWKGVPVSVSGGAGFQNLRDVFCLYSSVLHEFLVISGHEYYTNKILEKQHIFGKETIPQWGWGCLPISPRGRSPNLCEVPVLPEHKCGTSHREVLAQGSEQVTEPPRGCVFLCKPRKSPLPCLSLRWQ